MPEILGVIYDEDPSATGARVRDFHKGISGRTQSGDAYSALQPETYWWAHATFQWAVFQLIERFDYHRLTSHEREALYQDGVEWYRRYSVSMDPVPANYGEFVEKWNYVCDEVLELNAASSRGLDMALNEKVSNMPNFPSWSNPIQREIITPVFKHTAIGGLPKNVRERFDIPFSRNDAIRLRVFEEGVKANWRFVPDKFRWAPRALAGHQRVKAERRELRRAS